MEKNRRGSIIKKCIALGISLSLIGCRSGIKEGDVGVTTDGVRVVRDNGVECIVREGNRISFGDNFWYYADYNSEGVRAIKVITDKENILNGCNGWTVDNGILRRSVEIQKP